MFEKGVTLKVVFLKEKQETLDGIETYTKRSLNKTLRFAKSCICFCTVINEGKIYVFEDKLYLFLGYNKKGVTEIESFDLKTAQWKKEGALFR